MAILVVVKTAWIVENLQYVGGGCVFHLVYDISQVSARASELLNQYALCPGIPVLIYRFIGPDQASLIADGHLEELLKVGSALRFDIRLLKVYPFTPRLTIMWPDMNIGVDLAYMDQQ